MEIFHESVGSRSYCYKYDPYLRLLIQKDFFQLKELEKLGPKLKGIGTTRGISTIFASA